MTEERRFKDPHEIEDLPGTEGWEEMYPYYYPFASPEKMPNTAKYESSMLWFYDGLHYPEPIGPMDITFDDMWHHTASAWVGRIHVFPTNWGRDHRILNGRIYIDSTDVTDPVEIKKRVPLFQERVGYALKNWKSLYKKWEEKVTKLIKETEALEVPNLPDFEPMSVITEGKWSTGHDLLCVWNRLMEAVHLIWEWHFEFNNLVSLVNVQYIEAVKKLFPGITDKSITQTLSGFEAMIFKAMKALMELAKAAIELNIEETIVSSSRWEDISKILEQSDAGKKWLKAWADKQEPWFNMSCASGWYHSDESWNTNYSVPLHHIQEYIGMIKKGESIDKPMEDVLKERDRVTEEYRNLIKDEKDKKVFDTLLEQARTVSHYPEDHDFFVENWSHTVFYKKIREFGNIMVSHGVTKEVDDIFFMNRFEVPEVLYDIVASWYCGVPPYGQEYWPSKISRRKEIIDKFRAWRPPEALGPAPDDYTNPVMINEYGFDNETVNRWLAAEKVVPDEITEIKGYAGSAGVVEGPARVCRSVEDLKLIEKGDIIVAPSINPAWTAHFPSVAGIVTDISGIFGHAAIVAREYKIPAVVATGTATKIIKTGDTISCNGDTGVVKIIKRN
jgi:pyruvate, water dikinase